MTGLTQGALAAFIDHTLLKPEALSREIQQLCNEAKRYSFASVCIQPYHVRQAANWLDGSSVKVCTVVGFPLGANCSHTKAVETEQAVAQGATEIDMVINIGALKEGDDSAVEKDIYAVVQAANGQLVKVILETCLLSDEEIQRACRMAMKAGAQFVKTSTGFSKSGATVEHVTLMRQTVGKDFGVKASGGIRDLETLKKMIQAGANRIGTSSGVSLIESGIAKGDY